MPQQVNNFITAGLKGALGKQIVFRQRSGKTFVSAYPNMDNRVLSEKQLEVNRKMKEANQYAKEIIENEEERKEAQFRLDVPSTKLYTSLIKEYFKLQKIKNAS